MKPIALAVGATLVLCAGAVSAQQSPGGQPAVSPAQDAQDAGIELTLTRVLARVKLTAAQASRLAPVLDQAQERLKAAASAERAAAERLKQSV
ncbi:MAG: hypothetical protein FJX77_17015, partial [Armatimonadetes bacterium]|nr:hypothetical protein [Armatimonadota bacterium]